MLKNNTDKYLNMYFALFENNRESLEWLYHLNYKRNNQNDQADMVLLSLQHVMLHVDCQLGSWAVAAVKKNLTELENLTQFSDRFFCFSMYARCIQESNVIVLKRMFSKKCFLRAV